MSEEKYFLRIKGGDWVEVGPELFALQERASGFHSKFNVPDYVPCTGGFSANGVEGKIVHEFSNSSKED